MLVADPLQKLLSKWRKRCSKQSGERRRRHEERIYDFRIGRKPPIACRLCYAASLTTKSRDGWGWP